MRHASAACRNRRAELRACLSPELCGVEDALAALGEVEALCVYAPTAEHAEAG